MLCRVVAEYSYGDLAVFSTSADISGTSVKKLIGGLEIKVRLIEPRGAVGKPAWEQSKNGHSVLCSRLFRLMIEQLLDLVDCSKPMGSDAL